MRLRRQGQVNDLLQRLQREGLAEFAGLWIDHDDGGRVKIAFSGNVEVNLAAARRGFAEPDVLIGVPVANSGATLAALRDQIRADRALLSSSILGRYWFVTVEEDNNVVSMTVEGLTPAQRGFLEQRYGTAAFRVVDGAAPQPGATTNCPGDRHHCNNPLRGSIKIANITRGGECSLGFTGRDNATGGSIIITAGHCAEYGNLLSHNNRLIGTVSKSEIIALADSLKARENTSNWSISNLVYRAQYDDSYRIHHISGNTNVANGTALCNAGFVTGGPDCQTVMDGDWEGFVGPRYHYNQVQVRGCFREGDSGGPVYAANTAFAIAFGGSNTNQPNCGFSNDYYVASYIGHVQNHNGVTVRTSP